MSHLPSASPRASRLVAALLFGLCGVAACAASLPEPAAAASPGSAAVDDTEVSGGEAADELAKGKHRKRADAGAPDAASPDASPEDAGSAEPQCPFGRIEDGHSGFVRCLTQAEADALAPRVEDAGAADAPQDPAADASVDAGAPASAPPVVTVGAPVLEGGEIPKLPKSLAKTTAAVGRCIAEHGGLSGATGSLKLQFLVRGRGRAEGVEVVKAKGVGDDAVECVRLLLKNRAIGAPSTDPVGVTVTYALEAAPR